MTLDIQNTAFTDLTSMSFADFKTNYNAGNSIADQYYSLLGSAAHDAGLANVESYANLAHGVATNTGVNGQTANYFTEGVATIGDYEQILESLAYQNIAASITDGQRALEISVTDIHGATSSIASVDINVLNDDAVYGDASANTLNGDAQDNLIYGEDGTDILYGMDGNDILYGGDGIDILYGGAGADTFVFSGTDSADVIDGFNEVDGDIIDISDVLYNFDPVADDRSDFVQVTNDGTHSYLNVDTNGGADNFVQIVQINNNATVSDEDTLALNGNLIVV